MNLKVICLMTSVRGGSKLLQSLLDDHPQIIHFPRTFLLIPFLKKVEDFQEDPKRISDTFISDYERFFSGKVWSKYNRLDKADRLGPNGDESFEIDTNLFRSHFIDIYTQEKADKHSKRLFLSLHYSFQKAKNGFIPDSPIILYHIHDITYVEDLALCVNDFGIDNVKVLFTTRHPVDGLNATFNTYLFRNQLSPLFWYVREVFVFNSNPVASFPDLKIKIVLLELMKSFRKEIMLEIQKWCDLSWNDSLLKSTLMGKEWRGNAQKSKGDIQYKFVWFSPVGFFEKKDTMIFNTLFPSRMKLFGNSYQRRCRNKLLLSILMLMPLKVEVSFAIKSLSLIYWETAFTNIWKKVGEQDSSNLLTKRICACFLAFWRGNILQGIRFYIKRIKLSFSYLVNQPKLEKYDLVWGPNE